MTDLRVAVVSRWVYKEPLEEMVARGFETLGCEVVRSQGPVPGVDLTCAVKCDWVPPEQMSGKKVQWWVDHTSRGGFDKLPPGYDLVYTCHDEKVAKYLPCGYDPKFHYRVPGRKVWDITFVGTHRPEREWIRTVFSSLQRRGYSVGIWGNGWGPTDGLVAGEVYGVTRNTIVSHSKIVLNWMYPKDSVNMAFFQALASGAFVMSNLGGLQDLRFRLFEHYVPLRPAPREADFIEWLRRPIQRWLIAKNGAQAVRGHTYAARANVILHAVGLGP